MQNNTYKIALLEKIISVLSYITMGIVGLVWLIIAYLNKKRLKYFLMYNVSQSMVISIFLLIFKMVLDILFMILSKIPFLNFALAIINFFFSVKILRFSTGFSFTIFELLLFILLGYIILGVMLGRIFYIPWLSKIMNKTMKNYY